MTRSSQIPLWAAFLVTLTASTASAQSSASSVVSRVFEVHDQFCAPALGDPNAFIASLQSQLPAGTYATRTSPDGRLFRLTISSGSGTFNTQFSRYILTARGHENCATYFTDYTLSLTSSEMASAFKAYATGRVGADRIVGGVLPQLWADPTTGSDILQSQESDSYEFLMEGVIAGQGLQTVSGIGTGYISLVSQRDLVAQ